MDIFLFIGSTGKNNLCGYKLRLIQEETLIKEHQSQGFPSKSGGWCLYGGETNQPSVRSGFVYSTERLKTEIGNINYY